MFVIPEGPVNFWDIDDTLVRWTLRPEEQSLRFECRGKECYANPIKENVQELIRQSLKGSHTVVWSRGGTLWAEAAVKGLGLEKYVDVILSKPQNLYDDLDPEYWVPKRKHLEETEDGHNRC